MAEAPQLQPASVEATRPVPRPRSWPQIIIAIGVVLTLCYVAELVLVVLLVSILLAFILAPVVDLLHHGRVSRGLAAFIAVLLLLAVLYGITYFSYNQAVVFVRNLPNYSQRIAEVVSRFRSQTEHLNVLRQAGEEKNVIMVRPASAWADLLTRGFGSLYEGVLVLSFIPFLVYFMLSWQQHVRSATVMLFRMEHRHTAYVTLGLISNMIRSFMVGNLLIGLLISAVSIAVFGALHVPFFYFVGILSGFVSLVPYLGLLLALVPPLVVSLGQIHSGDALLIILTVFGLHLIALNVLYPKLLGNRLQLNPLAVTMALLFWGWLWGGIGLLLAIPITGAMKIVFDHVDSLRPYANWLGE